MKIRRIIQDLGLVVEALTGILCMSYGIRSGRIEFILVGALASVHELYVLLRRYGILPWRGFRYQRLITHLRAQGTRADGEIVSSSEVYWPRPGYQMKILLKIDNDKARTVEYREGVDWPEYRKDPMEYAQKRMPGRHVSVLYDPENLKFMHVDM